MSSGSNDYSLELLLKLGIDLTSEEVMNNSFSMLEKDISEFDKTLNEIYD